MQIQNFTKDLTIEYFQYLKTSDKNVGCHFCFSTAIGKDEQDITGFTNFCRTVVGPYIVNERCLMAGPKIPAGTHDFRQHFINFLFGLISGFLVAQVWLKDYIADHNLYLDVPPYKAEYSVTPATTFTESVDERGDFLGKYELSNWMKPRVEILCWILTCPKSLKKDTIAVKDTWAKRCNIVLYVSSQNDEHFPAVAVADHEGKRYLWEKTTGAFQYIYKHYLDKADWFLKADDDTFVIMENLRKLLFMYDPETPLYFGRKFRVPNSEIGYMQGGAGYVLSRKAVEVWVEKIMKSSDYADYTSRLPQEDIMVGKLLLNAGVTEGYSREGYQETFHGLAPEETIAPVEHPWAKHNWYPYKQGPACCSNYSISFHHVKPDNMYWLDYMVYRLRPFGDGYHRCPANISTILGLPELLPAGER